MPDQVYVLLAEKQRLLEEMLESAKAQLLGAAEGTDEALERLEDASAHRTALMAAVEDVDRKLKGMEIPAGDERTATARASMLSVLREIDECDKQARVFLQTMLGESGEQMRNAQRTRQGVDAYMGVQGQAGMYIDEKK